MCGRFGLTIELDALVEFFPFDPTTMTYQPRFNIAPTDPVLVYGVNGALTAEFMRWGLIPWFTKPGQKLPLAINAKSETVATQGMFKWPFQHRRCLVLSNGFYEWETVGKEKTPYRIGLDSWEPFAFAGLWDRWKNPVTGEETQSCTILTCPPNELIEPIHNRMPVILEPEHYGTWLDPQLTSGSPLQDILVPYPTDAMAMYEVSSLVNNVRNDVPEVVTPA